LLSSQGTDASFVLTRTLFGLSSGQFPFGLAFPTLSDLSDPISSVPFRFPLRPFGFRVSLSGGPNTIRHFPLF
ncbi:hypothetical protein, partial [Streptomyces sp. NPDC046821]|uniref:hypothetical protein n=1 Tax=Streptomyces sp. NPDC046821 TaxID=3154702 RepID=UPI0033FD4085